MNTTTRLFVPGIAGCFCSALLQASSIPVADAAEEQGSHSPSLLQRPALAPVIAKAKENAATGRLARLLITGVVMAVSSVATFSEAWAQAWAPQANPTSLMFQAVQGGPNPSSQAINLSKSTIDKVIWSSSEAKTWLSASPAWGTMTTSAQVVVSVNNSGLAAGTYSGNVVLALSVGGTVSVPITLTVIPVSSGGTSSTGTTPPPPPPPPPSTTGTTTTATLAWNSNTESDLAGYKVYVGTSSGRYGSPIDVGKVTSYAMANLNVGSTYYFVVTAYDTSGNESLHSAEVSKSIY